ncbi:hypothetical protein scyTo_0021482, partial [Scyliorhinus torazame]|nr:hypothetical protein [Scyliorhinus torazame]
NLALCLPKADATASYGSETLSEVLSEMITTVKTTSG